MKKVGYTNLMTWIIGSLLAAYFFVFQGTASVRCSK